MAVLDSGIATTSDLGSSRIVGWKDFVNKQKTPYDDAGHGTFVAGLIAGDGTASLPLDDGGFATVQFRGVAPQANIIGVKVLDSTGQGRASSVMAGVLWAIAHKQEYNIRVLNLSIGSNPVAPTDFDPIAQAVEFAWKNGITVVCAAGNEGEFGPGGILSPGNSPYVITVGATDTRQTATTGDDAVTYYSSVGPTLWDEYAKPDLVAPGNRLISLRVKDSYIDANFPQNLIPVASYVPAAPDDAEPELPHALRHQHVGAGGSRRGGPHDRQGPEPQPRRREGAHDRHRRPAARRHALPAGRRPPRRRRARWRATRRRTGTHSQRMSATERQSLLRTTTPPGTRSLWTKYGWTKFRWTKFRWTKFRWTKFRWTEFEWTEVPVDQVPVDRRGLDQVPVDQVPVDGLRLGEVQVDDPHRRAVSTRVLRTDRSDETAVRKRTAVSLYVALVCAAAAGVSVAAVASTNRRPFTINIVAFMILATLTDLREIKLPWVGDVTLSFVPVLAA